MVKIPKKKKNNTAPVMKNIFEKLLSKGGKATPNSKSTGKARPLAANNQRFRAANQELN